MKKHLKKIFFLMLSLLLLIQLIPLAASATSVTEEVQTPVEWELSEDEMKLYGNDKIYYYFQGYGNFYLDAATVYVYSQSIDSEELGTSQVYAVAPDSEVVWLTVGNYIYIYTTDKGVEELDAFLTGKPAAYRLENGERDTKTAYLDISFVNELESAVEELETITVDVSRLKNVEFHHIVAYDKTDTWAYIHGAVYLLNGDYYYLNYLTLGNQYFDADGNFSYRSGTVELTKLDSDLKTVLTEAIKQQEDRFVEYEWESDNITDDASKVIFWISLIIFGFLLPIPFLVIGLVLPYSEKRGYPKYWYTLAVIAAIWIVLSIILTLIMIM